MSWQQYAVAMLMFSLVSLLLTYIIERAQGCCRGIRNIWGA